MSIWMVNRRLPDARHTDSDLSLVWGRISVAVDPLLDLLWLPSKQPADADGWGNGAVAAVNAVVDRPCGQPQMGGQHVDRP